MRALSQRGNGLAAGLGLSVGSFAEQQQYVKDSLKIVVNSTNGNPYLSEDEVKGRSWDSISKQHAWDDPDWSVDSFTEAHGEVKQQCVFQDHHFGHQKPGEPGHQPAHIHVRPFDNTRNGQIPGTEEHYYYDKSLG